MENIKAGTAIKVATLVFVAINDKETAHHGKLFPPLKKASRPLSLFLTNSPITVVPKRNTINIIQFKVENLLVAMPFSSCANKVKQQNKLTNMAIVFFISGFIIFYITKPFIFYIFLIL